MSQRESQNYLELSLVPLIATHFQPLRLTLGEFLLGRQEQTSVHQIV